MPDQTPTTGADPSRPVDVTPEHNFAVGEPVNYAGTLGKQSGAVAEVRDLIDEHGTQLTAYVVLLDGLGRMLCSGDCLSRPAKAKRGKESGNG